LKYDVHNCCRIDGLPEAQRRLKTHMVGGGYGRFIQSMAQTPYNAIDL
jgi:hypothetical protein